MNRGVRNREAGITLIEVLVALAVIGVAAGATMMGVGDRGRSAETEATRLARHLAMAVDEALISGLPLALQWNGTGYIFGGMPPGQFLAGPEDWPPAMLPVIGTRHDLSGSLKLRLRNAGSTGAVVIPTSGAAQTVLFDIIDKEVSWTVAFDGFSARATPEGRP